MADLSRYLNYYTNPVTIKPNFSEEEARVIPWFRINADRSLRLNYDLNARSVVYDMGGYKGEWTRQIYKKYSCYVEVFEPVQKFAKDLEKQFKGIQKVQVHQFGLGGSNHTEEISLDLASSSTFKKGKQAEKISIIKASEFLAKQNRKIIDLMKINIEGGEYDLLNHLVQTGLIKNIKNLQIQFHIFVPNGRKERLKLQEKLSKTHELTYNYPFIWENWRLKK